MLCGDLTLDIWGLSESKIQSPAVWKCPLLRAMHRTSTHPHLSASGPSSSTDTKSSWKASSTIPHLLTHSAQLKHVDQPKNTFCTPEQSGAAALGSHYDSHIRKSHDWESSKSATSLDNKASGSLCKNFKFPTKREKLNSSAVSEVYQLPKAQ